MIVFIISLRSWSSSLCLWTAVDCSSTVHGLISPNPQTRPDICFLLCLGYICSHSTCLRSLQAAVIAAEALAIDIIVVVLAIVRHCKGCLLFSILSVIFIFIFKITNCDLKRIVVILRTKVVLLAFKPLLHNPFFEKNVKSIVLLRWLYC